MSKASEIEGALKRMNDAPFERLSLRVLPRVGFPSVRSSGRVLGEDKTHVGAVDGWFNLPNAKYGLVQCTTTQPRELRAKLLEDLEKALNSKLTHIPRARVGQVVLCHSHPLKPADDAAVRAAAKRLKCKIEIIGPEALTAELERGSADVAKDELNISIGTGQILSLDAFKQHSSAGKYATSFDTEFRFREQEMGVLTSAFSKAQVIMLKGKPGVGKSRLALEAMKQYKAAHPDLQAFCIVDKDLDLHDDLKVLCSRPGHYLLLVDDANELMSGRLKHVLRLLHASVPDRKFHILLTVRGYAQEAVAREVGAFAQLEVLEVKELTEEQITEFLQREYGIKNMRFLERISGQAQGNLRLAAMIGEVVKMHRSFDSIQSVEAIYSSYFRSRLGAELSELLHPEVLATAAMFSMLRAINRHDKGLMERVLAVTRLNENAFWSAATFLHRMEIVDMSRKEVGTIADQILASYLLHLAAFNETETPCLQPWELIASFLLDRSERVVEMLNSTFGVFHTEQVQAKVKEAAERALEAFEEAKATDSIQVYHERFAMIDPQRSLAYAQALVEATEIKSVSGPLDFSDEARQKAHWRSDCLKVLGSFGMASHEHRSEALKSMLAFLTKQPERAGEVAATVLGTFGVNLRSPDLDYRVQKQAIEELIALDPEGQNPMITGLFFTFAEDLLRLEYRQVSSGRKRNTVTLSNISAGASSGMLELRQKTWSHVFHLYTYPTHREAVFALFKAYQNSFFPRPSKAVLQADMDLILRFCNDHLEPSELRHCFFVHDLVASWHRHDLKRMQGVVEKFTNADFKLSQLLHFDRSRHPDIDFDERLKLWKEDLFAFGASLSPFGVRKTLARTGLIVQLDAGWHPVRVNQAIAQIMLGYYEAWPSDAVDAVLEHLKRGNRLNLPWSDLLPMLLAERDTASVIDAIDGYEFTNKWHWTVDYFDHITKQSGEGLRLLAEQFKKRVLECTAPAIHLPIHLLHRLEPVSPGITVDIIRHLLEHRAQDQSVNWTFCQLFREREYPEAALKQVFAGDLELLQKVYFQVMHERDVDKPRDWLNYFLDHDPLFLAKWVGWKYDRSRFVDPDDERGCFDFLWQRTDTEAVLTAMLDMLCARAQVTAGDNYLAGFLKLNEGASNESVLSKQDDFLFKEVDRNHASDRRMRLLFDMTHQLAPERRVALIVRLLQYQPDEDLFRDVVLHEGSGVTVGSRVPRYTRRIEFLTSIMQACTAPTLTPYAGLLREYIKGEKRWLEREQMDEYIEAVM